MLATHRLARLVTQDDLTKPLRDALARRAVEGRNPRLAELVECPHCVSVYFAFGTVVLGTVAPRQWAPIRAALAIAGAVSVIVEALDSVKTR